MKIIHTSDWHIGKKLYNIELEEDHKYFFEQLLEIIDNEQIDVLICSGDIFDNAFPSNSSLQLYYETLTRLSKSNLQSIVIVGGNHDSISTLNAPKQILETMNIHVIGGVPKIQNNEIEENDFEREIIKITNNKRELELIICAVPFLRERDIRKTYSGESFNDKMKLIAEGIENHYKKLSDMVFQYKEQNIPIIATGHLFAAGASNCDSEREIYSGTLQKTSSLIFSQNFDYVALGHIHRPQIISGNKIIRYSGSPIPLSFSEYSDKKIVILIDIIGGKISEIKDIELKKYREYLRFKGTFSEIKSSILDYKNNFKTNAVAEIEILESKTNPSILHEAELFFSKINNRIEVIHFTIQFADKIKGTDELFDTNVSIKDIDDTEVFLKRLEKEEIEDKEQLFSAYMELREEVLQNINLSSK